MTRVREADGSELRAEIEGGGRVLAEFWAPWCVQCGPMTSVVERLAETLPDDVSVLKVSVADAEVAAEFGVSALPAVSLYVGGEAAAAVSGFKLVPALQEALRPHLAGN